MNCKKEFLDHIKDRKVACAQIQHRPFFNTYDKEVLFNLPIDSSKKYLTFFLNAIDFEYDAGYGGQEVYGTIWYEDGTWSDRGEYDGSEWWQHHVCPLIPKELNP